MLTDLWPLFGLRLSTPRLELRVPDLDDLAALAAVAATGVHDPAVQPFAAEWTDGPPEQMRAAVLDLAFEGLGAEYAVSEAFADNAASYAVSRKLGYADDGIERANAVDANSAAQSQMHIAMQRLDREVRYAVGISRPYHAGLVRRPAHRADRQADVRAVPGAGVLAPRSTAAAPRATTTARPGGSRRDGAGQPATTTARPGVAAGTGPDSSRHPSGLGRVPTCRPQPGAGISAAHTRSDV
jgi:hypothetical protein